MRLGYQSDYEEVSFVRYMIDWRLFEKLSLQTQFSFEDGEDPAVSLEGQPSSSGVYLAGERYNLITGWIGLSYQLMEKVNATVAFRHQVRDSDVTFRNYSQNSVLLGVTYRF